MTDTWFASGNQRFLPNHLVPNLPRRLNDAEVIDARNYKLMQLEDIQHEQTPESYRSLLTRRRQCQDEGFLMRLIQWSDGTQGVLLMRLDEVPETERILSNYHTSRGMRELFEADGGKA